MRFKLADIAGKRPDGTIGACDTADKGDDDFCAPFAKVFGPKYFITDVLFTKDPVEVTEPRLAQMVRPVTYRVKQWWAYIRYQCA